MLRLGMNASTARRLSCALAAGLLAAGLALAAGCGGGDDIASPNATPTPLPPAPTATPTDAALAARAAAAADAAAALLPLPGEVGADAEDIQEQDPGLWINTAPFSLDSRRGGVVLIDFWTYTCVNCIRTLPYLKEWHEKYADAGLTIVGVHAPEFEFEKVRENVEAAVAEFDIRWPVVQDNDFATWRAYNNRFWPAKYLIDKDGVVQYTHFGEGAYDETEQEIRNLLLDAGVSLAGIPVNPDPGPEFDARAYSADSDTAQTRELYAGLNPQFLADVPFILQPEIYTAGPDQPVLFEDPEEHRNNFLYLNGIWTPRREHIQHSRNTEALEDYVALRYYGTSVNVVLEVHDEPYRVYVTQDGAPVPMADWGRDMQQDDAGDTYIQADTDRMYRLIESPEYSGHELRLSSNSDQFTLFAFTFGSYATGP